MKNRPQKIFLYKMFFQGTDFVGFYDEIDFENLKKVYSYHQQGIQNIQEHNVRILTLTKLPSS